MQYTHKDTHNNQTLPHPTTPLGTLIEKTPTTTHPRGKLVNYKRLACYEHCPGTFEQSDTLQFTVSQHIEKKLTLNETFN